MGKGCGRGRWGWGVRKRYTCVRRRAVRRAGSLNITPTFWAVLIWLFTARGRTTPDINNYAVYKGPSPYILRAMSSSLRHAATG